MKKLGQVLSWIFLPFPTAVYYAYKNFTAKNMRKAIAMVLLAVAMVGITYSINANEYNNLFANTRKRISEARKAIYQIREDLEKITAED